MRAEGQLCTAQGREGSVLTTPFAQRAVKLDCQLTGNSPNGMSLCSEARLCGYGGKGPGIVRTNWLHKEPIFLSEISGLAGVHSHQCDGRPIGSP